MAKNKSKKEALSVSRLINEILVSQLGIPLRNIINDASLHSYTGLKRPDLLISNIEYDLTLKNDSDFVSNLLCYAEIKDPTCIIGSSDWKNAFKQGMEKAPKLKMPFFAITNCHTTYFYNSKTGKQISINGKIISEFQTLDIFRIIKKKISDNPDIFDIQIGVDSLSSVSEAIFNKKLWELREVYREIDFANGTEKIDFTIGMIALEYYEEKAIIDGNKDYKLDYWSSGKEYSKSENFAPRLKTLIETYIDRLNKPGSDFYEFTELLKVVESLLKTDRINARQLQSIYCIIDSMKPMHGTGFDLFGAVYENFANSKEKKDFGEYFTRRHYAHVFAELLLKDEETFREIKIIDPSCGTGGMLTESFKVLRAMYDTNGIYDKKTSDYLARECFYGIDIRSENITRTKLNMFLVGDGHTNMLSDNALLPEKSLGKKILTEDQYDYLITNPPYGFGTIKAKTDKLSSYRMEVAFLCKNIDLLKEGGKACIITPDGILENPSFTKLRSEILSTCKIEAIISLPKFAFAPYTKEKTYAIFFKKIHNRDFDSSGKNKKKNNRSTGRYQDDPIWMYIIDHDGYANSDKRFPTRLRGLNQEWLHDEVSGYSDNNGLEHKSILIQRWISKFDDSISDGTEWIDDKGIKKKLRKGGQIAIEKIIENKYLTLLPEFYLRPYQPHYITEDDLKSEIDSILLDLKKII